LYYVEAIDAGNQKIKSILETKYGNGKRLSTKMLRFAKKKQRFSGVIWEKTTAIAFDEWYDTRNTKTYLFNPDAAQNPKMISDRILKTFTLIQEV
jgi:hypothetical protein